MKREALKVRDTRSADRRMLANGLTLMGLGLSILFLNSWDNVFVRTTVALFWAAFVLVLNGPDTLRTLRKLKQKYDIQRRRTYPSAT